MDPYPPLFSVIRTQREHVKIAIDASLPRADTSDKNLVEEQQQKCIFAIISNVEQGFEECCILVCKRRRNNINQVKVIEGLAIGSDFQATIQQSESTVSPVGTSLLQFILTSRGKTVSGLSADSQGIKDLIAAARDAAKTLSQTSLQPSHDWVLHYIDMESSSRSSGSKSNIGSTGDVPIFSRFTTSSIAPLQSASDRPRPPSPAEKELRVSIGTFNTNGQMPGQTDLNAWLHVDEDEPDVLVVGLQEAESSNLSYVVWTPHVEDAWRAAVENSMGRRAGEYEKVSGSRTVTYQSSYRLMGTCTCFFQLATKQLVGILMLVYVRREISPRISALATSSVGVGFGGWVANKGATAVRFELDDELPICFVVSHLSAFDTLEARERRRWDYGEIVKRLRFTLIEMEDDYNEREVVGVSTDVTPSIAKQTEEEKPERDAEALLRAALNRDHVLGADESTDVSWAADDSQQIRKRQVAIFDHDVVFWSGDLNFRLELGIGEVKRLIQKRQFESALLTFDQLRSEMQTETCFQGFQEQKIWWVIEIDTKKKEYMHLQSFPSIQFCTYVQV